MFPNKQDSQAQFASREELILEIYRRDAEKLKALGILSTLPVDLEAKEQLNMIWLLIPGPWQWILLWQ
jgi:hypothetical protein